MLINLDARQLEWLCAVYLSKDPIGYEEVRAGVDLHTVNQERFKLPLRVIAKIFLFRLIYADPETAAMAYARDPEFAGTSKSPRYWQGVIDEAYEKYTGLFGTWHTQILQEVSRTGSLEVCTGRRYKFFRENGRVPVAKVFNYPVQGLGHDLLAIVRVALLKRLRKNGLTALLVTTVHDSIMLDAPITEVGQICELIFEVFDDVPRLFELLFKVPFDLPCRTEIKIGHDWGNMIEITKDQICVLKSQPVESLSPKLVRTTRSTTSSSLPTTAMVRS